MRRTWHRTITGLLILALLLVQGPLSYAALPAITASPSVPAGAELQTQLQPPARLQAVLENDTVILTWEPASNEAVTYKIYRDQVEIGLTSSLLYADDDPPTGVHTYTVKASNAEGRLSPPSNTVTLDLVRQPQEATLLESPVQEQQPEQEPEQDPEQEPVQEPVPEPLEPPAGPTQPDQPPREETSLTPPGHLTITAQTENSVTLDWEASAGSTDPITYTVLRNGEETAALAETTYTDTGLTPGTYIYQVKASSNNLSSENSDEVTANLTPTITLPSPANLRVLSKTSNSVTITWDTVADWNEPVSYRIFRDGEEIAAVPDATYTDHNVLPGTVYLYSIKACDANGNASPNSNQLSVTISNIDTNMKRIPLTAGAQHSLMIKNDGTVWAWGDNQYGQLGDDSTRCSNRVVKVKGLTEIVSVAGGKDHSLALMSDGTVWAWGSNSSGQLGTGDKQDSLHPVLVPGLSNITAISAGNGNSMALTAEGIVYGWGAGLGNIPILIEGLPGIENISAGYIYGAAVATDGSVFFIVPNQVSSGDFSIYQVPNLSDVTEICSVAGVFAAVKSDGTVWIWMDETEQIPGLNSIISIAGGAEHIVALASDGKVWTFGSNEYGQLGIEAKDNEYSVQVPGLSGVDVVAAGEHHSLAMTGDGSVWTWGANGAGQLGDGSNSSSGIPFELAIDNIPPTIPMNLKVISHTEESLILEWEHSNAYTGLAGYDIYRNAEAIGKTIENTFSDSGLEKNQVYEYYVKAVDVIGNFSDESNHVFFDNLPPSPPTNLEANTIKATIVDLKWAASSDNDEIAGYEVYRNSELVATVAADKTEYVDHGLQAETTYSYTVRACDRAGNRSKPSRDLNIVTEQRGVCSHLLAAGSLHSMVIKNDNSLWTWGNNSNGQLGDGSFTGRPLPKLVQGIVQPVSISGGDRYSLALDQNGSLWAWGSNSCGQLGNGNRENRNIPELIGGISGVIEMSAGYNHSLAVVEDGTVWGWGSNESSQLGDCGDRVCTVPQKIEGLAGCAAVAAGSNHSVALQEDGKVLAWGSNAYGQLGNGGKQSSRIPVNVNGLAEVDELSAGREHNLALRKDGTVWAWGSNSDGQLGNGDGHDSSIPVQVHGITGVVSVKAGGRSSMALREDGSVWTWGDNYRGQLGNGNNIDSKVPVKVDISNRVTAISAGDDHGLAMDEEGTVWAWGYNLSGQLGNGSNGNSNVPVTTCGDTEAPSAPSRLIINATSTSANLRWLPSHDVMGVAGYEVYRNEAKIADTSATAYLDDYLSPDEIYIYYVKAFDAVGNISAPSPPATRDYLPPEAPTNLNVEKVTTTSVSLKWDAAKDDVGVARYAVYRNDILIAFADTTGYGDAGLIPGQCYAYKVRALDAGENESPPGNEVTVSTDADLGAPSAPTGIFIAGAGPTGIRLQWTATHDDSGISKYIIYQNDTLLAETTYEWYQVSTFTKGDVFMIRAVDLAGNISQPSQPFIFEDDHGNDFKYSSEVSLSTKINGNIDYKEDIDFFHFQPAEAGKYEITYQGNGTLETIVELFDSSHQLIDQKYTHGEWQSLFLSAHLQKEKDYYIGIYHGYSYNVIYSGSYSFQIDYLDGCPSAPADLAVTTTLTSATLAWSPSTDDIGVTGYQVFLNGSFRGQTSATSYTFTNLLPNQTYTLGVKAFDAAGNYSPESQITIVTGEDSEPPTAPGDLQAEKRGRDIKLIWTKSTDNHSLNQYIIYRDDQERARTSGLTYTDPSLPDGTYSYHVRARDSAGNLSLPSNTVTVSTFPDTTPPEAPAGLQLLNRTGDSITLQWNPATDDVGVSGYNLYRNGISIGFTTKLTFIDTAYDHNGINTYTVRARDAEGNLSPPSNTAVLEFIPPSIPVNLSLHTQTAASITITWTASTDNIGVAGYEVCRNGQKLGDTPTTTYTDNGLQNDTTYTYTVKAYDNCGNYSEPSSPLAVQTSPDTQPPGIPAQLTLVACSGSTITIRWAASSDNVRVDKYEIYRGGQPIGETRSTTYTDSGLTAGTTYTYTVKALDTAGNPSAASQELTATPQMPEITAVQPAEGALLGGVCSQPLTLTSKNTGDTGATLTIEYSPDESTWSSSGLQVRGPFPRDAAASCYQATWDLHPLPSGNYTLSYTLTDSSGNTARQTRHYQLDRTAPLTPANFTVTALSNGSGIELRWDPPVDTDIGHYQVYRSSEETSGFKPLIEVKGRDTCTYIDRSAPPGAACYYQLTAVDHFQQESPPTPVAGTTASLDNYRPIIRSILPRYGSRIGLNPTLAIVAEDNAALAAITLQYSADTGANWQEISTQATASRASIPWNTAGLSGEIFIRALATDSSGNQSDGTPVMVYTIDHQGPAPIEGLTAVPAANSVLLKWKDSSDNDLDYFQAEKRTATETAFTPCGTSSQRLGLNVTGLAVNTDYWFRVVGYDQAGNRGEPSAELQVRTTADKEAPVVTVLGPVAGYYSQEIPLAATASDNTAVTQITFQYSRERAQWTDIETLAPPPAPQVSVTCNWNTAALPEGTYYVRALARDQEGNDNHLTASFIEYRIDHSPPQYTPVVTITPTGGYLQLTWPQPSEEGIAAFRVYRSTGPTGPGEKIAEVRALGYLDRQVDFGVTYYYQVAALDRAGQEGTSSEIVSGTLAEDSEAPCILSVSPVAGSILAGHPTIRVLASDNYRLSRVALEYKSAAAADDWHSIATQEAASSSQVVSFTWDTTGLTDGDYLLRATAFDSGGRSAVSGELNYQLRAEPLAAPLLTATPGDWKVELDWQADYSADLTGFKIYRSTVAGSSYLPVATTTATTYTDAPLSPEREYYYLVEALDRYGNRSRSNEASARPLGRDPYPPTAEAGEDQSCPAGLDLVLDGSLSRDNDRIETCQWQFGDGQEAQGPRVTHSYQQPGEYTATLVVSDPSGNTSTDTCTISVGAEVRATDLDISVLDIESGAGLAAASIVVEGPGGSRRIFPGDSQGRLQVAAEIGANQVYAYSQGYLPAQVDTPVEADQPNSVVLRLRKSQLVEGEIKVRRLEIDEIKEKGIDVTAPENQFVYEYILDLGFLRPSFWCNGWGQTLYWDGPGWLTPYAIPYLFDSGDSAPALAVLKAPGEATWLKEFFDVGLIVKNLADPQFILEAAQARLQLPQGLSLAPTAAPQTTDQALEPIAGGESREVNWVIRGDKKGDYTVGVDFSALVQPFGESVTAHFTNQEPIKVWGGEALNLVVKCERYARQGEYYQILMQYTNVSDHPVYNLTNRLDPGPEYELLPTWSYNFNQEKLEPGEIANFWYVVIPKFSGTFYPHLSWVTYVDGERVKSSVTYLSGDEKLYLQQADSARENPNNPGDNATKPQPREADPVNPASGALLAERSLLSLQGAIPLELKAQYNSQLLNPGPMGRGWDHGLNIRLRELENGHVVIQWSPNHWNAFLRNSDTTYTPLDKNMRQEKLVQNPDGSFTLTRKDQSTYEFDRIGLLSSQKDQYGRTLDFTYEQGTRLANVSEPRSQSRIDFTYNQSGRLSIASDSAGRQVTFTYEGSDLVAITNASGATTHFQYDPDGHLLQETDGQGQTVYINHYDSEGRVIGQQDGRSQGAGYSFFYQDDDPQYHYTTVTDRSGQNRTYTCNYQQELLELRDPLGQTTRYTYDANGNCTSVTDARGLTTHYRYDERNNLITVIDPAGHQSALSYDPQNNLIALTSARGDTIRYTYNPDNTVSSKTDPQGRTTSYHYDQGMLTQITQPGGGSTRYTYQNGRPQTWTDPSGRTVTYAYDQAGRVSALTNPLGQTTRLEYDPQGNLISQTDPLGQTTRFTYDSNGQKTSRTDPQGHTTGYQYDANLNLIALTDPLGQTTRFTYDSEDRLSSLTDPRGNTTTYSYDPGGRLATTTNPLGHTTRMYYDPVGNLAALDDPLGQRILTLQYNHLNQITRLTDPLGRTVSYQYDPQGQLVQTTDPRGNSSSYSYDPNGRLLSARQVGETSAAQQYDPDGNLTALTDALGNTTTFSYDPAGRILSRTSATGATITYAYDQAGCLEQTSNARGQTAHYQYDQAGRLISLTDPAGTITYTYDARGNVTTISDPVGTIRYQYDPLNRVTQYTDVYGDQIKYNYDANGNLTTLTYPDGKQVKYSYDPCNQLSSVTDWNNRTTAYSYDPNGRLSQTTRPDGSVETRSYDPAGQLIQLKDTDKNGNLIQQYDYTYDQNGNISSEQPDTMPQPLAPPDKTMTYGADNRLLTCNGQNIEYDADGNLTRGPLQGQMQNFHYDCRNRLVSAGNTSYTYDAQNHRTAVNHNGETRYTISPGHLSQVLIRTAPDGQKTYYIHGLGLIGQENPDGSYQSYHYDYRGSTIAITDQNGAITDHYQYAPYGELIHRQGTTDTPFLYNGRDGVMSDANGLYYMRARYYHPEILRFINQDILLGNPASPQSLNRYAYVNGQPVNYIDPFGLCREKVKRKINKLKNKLMKPEHTPRPGYLDFNIAGPGLTIGGMLDMDGGLHIYFGPTLGSSGGSLTVSPYDSATEGVYVTAQGFAIAGGQIGYNLGDPDFVWEAGAGTPGASVAVIYVSDTIIDLY